ncbi:MAG: hypothetical protein CVU88_02475 [Firmicutes bacterium HGW-Firmicutes-13]|nr:MAG: hypothetical protein CVU88_02475 [Firmicutes bacterium HGW-Firmicutes-13]
MQVMRIKDVVFDQLMGSVVLLVDLQETIILPIWVGLFEAQAIAIGIHQVDTPRPMTHDLMNNLCCILGAEVNKIVVNDIKDGTYYAEIYLSKGKEEIVVDSRPSDAIALALKAGVELYITDKVASQAIDMKDLDEEKQQELKALLDSLKPDDEKKMLH